MPDPSSEPFTPDWRVKPGELLKEAIVARHWLALDACKHLGWRLGKLVRILNAEEAIDAAAAADLARVFKNSQHYWLELQRLYDEPPADRHGD
jgi:plasmid maintenance system antidote protein VapI